MIAAVTTAALLGFLLGVAAVLSPRFLPLVAAQCIAQAEAVEAYNRIRPDALKFWREKLEVARG